MNGPPLLILSATIRPNGPAQLTLTDPDARRKQYLQAIHFWLSRPLVKIVFVENSGADLSDFQALANDAADRLEIIGLPSEPYPAELGKGYGEFRMIDAAVRQSRSVQDATHFGKITGRLTIRNLPSLWQALPADIDLAADAHLRPKHANGGWADSRLVFFSTSFYRQHATGVYHTMNDSQAYFAEHAIFRLMQTAPPAAHILTRLPVEPAWKGSSGTTGVAYDSLLARLKLPLKRLRRVRDRWLNRPSLEQVRAAAKTLS